MNKLPLLSFALLAACSASAPDDTESSTDSGIPDIPGVVIPPTSVYCDLSGLKTELKDGVRYGLPTKNIPVLPPVVTPQTSKTPPEMHFRKAVGVLNLTPNVRDLQAAEHMLRPMGIPYAITTSPKLSIQHDLTLFFPEAYPENFDADELATIKMYLDNGGTLVLKGSEVPELKQLGGINKTVFKLPHFRVDLTDAGKREFPTLNHAHEQSLPLGGTTKEYLNTWVLELAPGSGAEVLARFDDGTPAIVKNKVGPGAVYTFGVDWRDLIIRNQLGYAMGGARDYINVFEPATDAWMLMLRDIYDARVEFGVRLHTAPNGARAALLLSHDLDWGPSYENSIVYAADEKARNASATYFLHTKYLRDAQDEAFFRADRAPLAARFLELGATVGSHTVAHSKMLDKMPVGDGTETYPQYKPINITKFETTGGTMFGEGRVSKSLIDGFLELCNVRHDVVSFRAGELSFHMASPTVLERLGYRFDSSRAVGEVLTNFPYRLMTDWPDAYDTSMFEIPVTLEDELPPRLDERVDAMRAVVEANAQNGAPTTLLIHPNVLDYKLEAQQHLLKTLPNGVIAMGLEPYAAFWRARDEVHIDAVDYDWDVQTVTVKLTTKSPISGLTLRVGRTVDSVLAPTAATFARQPDGAGFVTLPTLAGATQTTVVMHFVR